MSTHTSLHVMSSPAFIFKEFVSLLFELLFEFTLFQELFTTVIIKLIIIIVGELVIISIADNRGGLL